MNWTEKKTTHKKTFSQIVFTCFLDALASLRPILDSLSGDFEMSVTEALIEKLARLILIWGLPIVWQATEI